MQKTKSPPRNQKLFQFINNMSYDKDSIFYKLRRKYLGHLRSGTADQWHEWQTQTKKNQPKLYFILETIPAKINRWWYENITDRFSEYAARYWHKPHQVTIDIERFPVNRWGKSTRRYFNYRSTTIFLYVNFQILVDEIESLPEGKLALNQARADIGREWGELEVLYLWWTETRPKRDTVLPDLKDFGLADNIWGKDENGVDNKDKRRYSEYNDAMDKVDNREKRYEKIDTEMIERLMAICKYLRY